MKKSKSAPNVEEDPLEVRNRFVDTLIGSAFQLSATGTIFVIGSESTPSWEDVLFVLNRLYTTGYAEEYKLLPYNVDPAILISGLSKEVVAWLVPLIIQAIDRKVMGSEIDILSPNNKNLVRLADVLGWYWYKHLHGPKPVVTDLIKIEKHHKLVQNAYLTCPLCYHQFIPASSYKNQSDKAFAFARWLPTHLVQYHKFHDTNKSRGAKCQCGVCNGKLKIYGKGGTKS